MASINIDMAVSGARECQTQINAAATSVKQMQSALKLADSEFKLTGDATAMYTSKVQTLQAQINAQTQAVEAAQRGLQTMADAYGENSTQAAAWQAKVNTAQAALNNMQASLNEMTGKLAESSAAMSSTAGAAGSLAGALSGMAGGSYSMDGLNSSLAGSQTEIQKTSDQLAELQNQVKETGGLFYNVGNMSISAANGGKVASAISSIAKGMESVVKSAAETASHTDDLGSIILGGMSGGTMTAGGVMSTVGGVVSNFGPWGAVAGAVLNLGGSIADAVTEGMERREKAQREEQLNSYWSVMGSQSLEKIADSLSGRGEISAEIMQNVTAHVTADVGDLRVVIEQATEDGHVDRREVGAVKEYVEKVLMADYDDAVFELMRMRGELWVLATQGYTPEEVAMYGDMSKPENSNLYLFLKSFLGDDQNSYIQQFFDNDEQVQNAATNLWLFLSKKFGSADAMVEAFKDPEQKDVVQGFISEWLQTTFGAKGLSLSKANLTAANLMTRLWSLIDMDFAGSNADKSGNWFGNTEGGGIFLSWMESMLTEGDKQDALDYARDMWRAVLEAATDPEAAVQTLHDTSGADAAADYRAGKKTNAAAQFGAMVDWVMKTLKISDKNEAIRIAIDMWDQVRRAASYGVTGTGTLSMDTSWITGTKAGTVFQDWVAANLTDGDKEEAEKTARNMWASVVAAASSPEAAIGAIYSATGEEAAAAAKANPDSSTGKTFNAFLAWVNENYPELDADDAEKEAIRLWNAVRVAAATGSKDGRAGTVLTLDTSWILTTSAGTVFTDWVEKVLPEEDKKNAVGYAQGLWGEVIAAASSPEAAIGALSSATGEEAAAAYEAGEDSDTAKGFGVMVKWCEDVLGNDHNTAIKNAIGMWDTLRTAAFSGIDESGTDHKAHTGSYTFTGSEAMRNYIAKVMGVDFEAAISDANDYWDRLTDAVLGKTQKDKDKPDLRADLLAQALEEYQQTLSELERVTGEMPGLTGDALDEKIKELENLLDRAEKLANRIDMLRGDELKQAEGAYNLVTYGKGRVSQSDMDTAMAYLDTLNKTAEQARADKLSAADAARWNVYSNPDATDDEKAAADKARNKAYAQAESEYRQQMDSYAQMMGLMINSVIERETGYSGWDGTGEAPQITPAAMAVFMQYAESGLFKDWTNDMIQTFAGQGGPVRDALFELLFKSQAGYYGEDNGELYGSVGGLAELAYFRSNGWDYSLRGNKYNDISEIPFGAFADAMATRYYLSGKEDDLTAGWFSGMGFSPFDWYLASKNGSAYQREPVVMQEAPAEAPETAGKDYDDRGSDAERPPAQEPGGAGKGGKKMVNFDDMIADAGEAGTEAGENLDSSLAAAITQNAATPESAASTMADRVASAVRRTLGIASPSKVMMAFGAYTAQGLAEGIDASMAMVTRASRRMASAVVSPMSDAAASAGRTVNNSATSSLYIDKYYQRSDADVDSLAAAIADKNRLGRYGNGLRN